MKTTCIRQVLLLLIMVAAAPVWPLSSDRDLLGCQFNSVDDLIERARVGSVRVLDRTGQRFLSSPGKKYFAPVVRVSKLPEYVLEALIAKEDRRFYQHKGNDWFGIARAALVNLRALGVRQGGSSITNQAIGLSCFGHLGRWIRRIAEIIVSPKAETVLKKAEIATLYLNVADFGSGTFGIEAASRVFFGKGATTLTLPETVLIIQALSRPSVYNVRKTLIKQESVRICFSLKCSSRASLVKPR
jgi:penicillin-binding protein 1A